MKKITFMLVGFPSIIISVFITYTILREIEVDRLIWFLFWVNVPLVILLNSVKDSLKD